MPNSNKSLLLIGASRGLGLALAEEYVKRGWRVVATARGAKRTALHELAERSGGRLEVEIVDINHPDQVAALRARLGSRRFDMLFVNAGVTNDDRETIGDVSTDEFVRVMVTNALSPMRVVEALQDVVSATGTIAAMSSGQGSVANNQTGNHEVYRGSKAALNMFMRSFAARHKARSANPAAISAGLGQDGLGRPTCASEHRGKHSEPRRRDRRARGQERSAVPRLSRPDGSVVSPAMPWNRRGLLRLAERCAGIVRLPIMCPAAPAKRCGWR